MEQNKLTIKEKIVIYSLMLGTILVGISLVTFYPLDVSGKMVPPNSLQAIILVVVGAITILATIVLAIRLMGVKEGLKLLLREAWSGLLFGCIIGVLGGFFIRAIFYRFGFLLIIAILYIATVSYIYSIHHNNNQSDRESKS